MFMRTSQLKGLIKEIIREYFNEGRYGKYEKIKGIGGVRGVRSAQRGLLKHVPLNIDPSSPKMGTRIKVPSTMIKRKYYSDKVIRIKIPAGTEGFVKELVVGFNVGAISPKNFRIVGPTGKKNVPQPLTSHQLRYIVNLGKYGYVSLTRDEFEVIK
jgi:hypothetical protein